MSVLGLGAVLSQRAPPGPPVDTASDAMTHYSYELGKDPEIVELEQFLAQGYLPDDVQCHSQEHCSTSPIFYL